MGIKQNLYIWQEFDLQPGENVVATEFHYEPADANDTVAQVRALNIDRILDLCNDIMS